MADDVRHTLTQGIGLTPASIKWIIVDGIGFASTPTGWTNITKVNGIASASVSKVDGVAVASISKLNGVSV